MSDGRKYYCFCEANCKFETMTKEQILAAIAQAAETGLVFDTEAAFITKVKEGNAGSSLTFWLGTQAQYNALVAAGKKDPQCFYILTDCDAPAELTQKVKALQQALAEIPVAINAAVQKTARANLLDNWYFGNPVNQRGQTVYDGSGYCIDRWKNGAVSVIKGEGLKATYADSIIMQSLEAELKAAIDGKECTVSVICDGVMNTNTFTYTAAPSAATLVMYGENVNVTILTGGTIHIAFRAVNSVIQAVKLELGDFQTLAHNENGVWVLNEIPNYGTELLKCQRYFYKFNKYLLPSMSFDNAAWWFTLDFPVPMRVTPVIVGLDSGALIAGGNPLSGATFELGRCNAEQVDVTCTYSTFDPAQNYSVSYIDGYAYASADL